MTALRLLAALALAVAVALLLMTLSARPPRFSHPTAAFRGAACLCPLCVVTEGLLEISWSEYC